MAGTSSKMTRRLNRRVISKERGRARTKIRNSPFKKLHVRVSVITPAYPGRWKNGQNDGNPCAYSEKPTSRRKFLGFFIFYRDFLYFPMFCYIFLGFPINGRPHLPQSIPKVSLSCLLRRAVLAQQSAICHSSTYCKKG